MAGCDSAHLFSEQGEFNHKYASDHLSNGLGQMARPSDIHASDIAVPDGLLPKQMAEYTNRIQKFFIENTRLGIPVVFHEECLHGHAANRATSFPQPIGLAATFNPDLIHHIFEVIAKEVRYRGAHQVLAPVADIARDPRWGRVEETFGEDPFLATQMTVAAIRGIQGDQDFSNKEKLIATLKHFVGHGQPESGTNCAPANVSERVLRQVFFPPFKAAIQQAGAVSVMASYNEVDAVPSHINCKLLRSVLRDEWGFDGYIVSDYFAVKELHKREDTFDHGIATTKQDAAVLAAQAGVNIELPDGEYYPELVDAVKEGRIDERLIDELIEKPLEFKFRLGLFDDPYVDPERAEQFVANKDNGALALESARQTITLLKNDDHVLPIDRQNVKTLAVIGPNADREMLGGYSGAPVHYSTVYQGIRDKAGDVEVLYSEGCKITIDGAWHQDNVILPEENKDRALIREAVETAKKADVIILAVGGNEQTSREAWALNHMGDRTDLELFGRQNELVKALADLGKPIAAVLFNGRPLSFNILNQNVSAILECWYLGQASGEAVAEAVFGDLNPGGKLPMSIPRSVGHIPVFYNHKPSARRGYLDADKSPLFPFGFGKSYTTFEFSVPSLDKPKIKRDEETRISVDVTNTGTCKGDEVVQLYIRDVRSSVTRPVKELKAFERITLEPDEKRTLTFTITPDMLAFYDISMEYSVEPGEFWLMVGDSSQDVDLQTVTLTVKS
ncbi:MAG: glycoside hydrolase family 3 N-terminal domain-containing protein [candidate division KSB1 bacterium]|nr:glycoside hydrolase family 3 N-terminal domain-containing protein [candidate division KSB1 bacterium]